MVIVAHVWPGITPLNVWGLTFGDWLVFADAADDWAKARENAAKQPARQSRRRR